MPGRQNDTLLIIAYGSLLSGYGILAERRGGASRLVARDAFPVTLSNARRGLAKPSSHGHYLAMDLEPMTAGEPLAARPADRVADGIGVLGLEFDRAWAPLIARREEYDPAKFVALLELAERAGQSLGAFLYAIAERTRFNLLAYRTALRELLDYTSHGYIFHPVPLADGRIGLAAIGSGYEGSGDPAVRSKRNEYGMDRLLPLAAALDVTTFALDQAGQVGYFVECILGGYHGLAVGDLAEGLDPASPLGAEIGRRVAAAVPGERTRFLTATSLDEAAYQRTFDGAIDPRLRALFAPARQD